MIKIGERGLYFVGIAPDGVAEEIPGGEEGLSATVCWVHPEGTVTLAIFDRHGNLLHRTKVRVAKAGEPQENGRYFLSEHTLMVAEINAALTELDAAGAEEIVIAEGEVPKDPPPKVPEGTNSY